jgi:hypothetical protein
MRGLVGRLNHRDAVLSNLNAILLFYPPKRQFSDDFPKLRSAVRAHFDDGVAAPLSALQIAETIIENFIGQLGEREKSAALDALIAAGRQGFAEIAERRVQGAREQPGDNITFVTRLTGVAIFMSGRLAEEGAVGRSDHQRFVERLAAALGADAERTKVLNNCFGVG